MPIVNHSYPKDFNIKDIAMSSAIPIKYVDAARYSFATHGPGISVMSLADDDVTITMLADIQATETFVVPLAAGVPLVGWVRNVTDGGSTFAAGLVYVGLPSCTAEQYTTGTA